MSKLLQQSLEQLPALKKVYDEAYRAGLNPYYHPVMKKVFIASSVSNKSIEITPDTNLGEFA